MCGAFGEVTAIIGLVINILAVGTLSSNSHDNLSSNLCTFGSNSRQIYEFNAMRRACEEEDLASIVPNCVDTQRAPYPIKTDQPNAFPQMLKE